MTKFYPLILIFVALPLVPVETAQSVDRQKGGKNPLSPVNCYESVPGFCVEQITAPWPRHADRVARRKGVRLSVEEAPTASPEAPAEELNLFASGDFSAWTNVDGSPVGEGWKFENGILSRPGATGDIITKEKYKDFELSFEWKISEAGNSGVKYRSRERLGLEYQVLDDEKHPDREKPNHRAGSLYELVAAPDDKPLKPVGEWNTSKIRAKGNLIEHWLNGEKVVSVEWGTDDWFERFNASKYKRHEGFGSWKGPILLQDHKDPVWYRNLKVRKL